MKKAIKTEKHGEGFRAFLVNNTAQWEYGETQTEAIGKLVQSRQKELGITIYQGEDLLTPKYLETMNHHDYDQVVMFLNKNNVQMLDRRKDICRILALIPPGMYKKMISEVEFVSTILYGDEPTLSKA